MSIVGKLNQYIFSVALAVVALINYSINRKTQPISNAINNVISNYQSKNKAISQSRTKVKDVSKTNKKNEDTTKLYRAMDYIEYNRFTKAGGKFSNNAPERPNIMDTKCFATNPINADKWGAPLNPNGYKIIEIRRSIDKSLCSGDLRYLFENAPKHFLKKGKRFIIFDGPFPIANGEVLTDFIN
jgi:hypothetical protein